MDQHWAMINNTFFIKNKSQYTRELKFDLQQKLDLSYNKSR